MELTEELALPGVRLRHPPEAAVTRDEIHTRSRRVRTLRIRAPWVTSESDPGLGAPYEVRIMIFEHPSGSDAPTAMEPAPERIPDRSSPRYRMESGFLGGRKAMLRIPLDRGEMERAAYIRGESRFFFVEWRGPVGGILDTLELLG